MNVRDESLKMTTWTLMLIDHISKMKNLTDICTTKSNLSLKVVYVIFWLY